MCVLIMWDDGAHIVSRAVTRALFNLDPSQQCRIQKSVSVSVYELNRSQVRLNSHQIRVEQAEGTDSGCHPSIV